MMRTAMKTKTSFTIERSLYERAEGLSKQLHLSRSEFYARAIADYVYAIEERELKERINAAQASLSQDAQAEGQAVAAFLRRAATRPLNQNTELAAW